MSDADVAVPPAAVTEATDSGDLPAALPPAVTVNGAADDALVAGPATQAATDNVGGLDVGTPRIEITDDAQQKYSTPEIGAAASEKRPDDFTPAAKPGKLEVNKLPCVVGGRAMLNYRIAFGDFQIWSS